VDRSVARRIGIPLLVGLALVWLALMARDFMTLAKYSYQDLDHFTQGGQFVRDGLSPYTTAFTQVGNGLPYIYPPVWALVFAPLSVLPVVVLRIAWTGATLVALWALVAVSIRLLTAAEPGGHKQRLLLITAATIVTLPLGAVSEVLYFGQVGVLVVLACTLDAVLLRERRSKWQGVLVGIATAIKLTPALVIVHWVLTRQFRAAVTAGVTTLACWGGAAVLLPKLVADYFFGGFVFGIAGRIGAERVNNQSVFGLLTRLLGETPPMPLYLALAGTVALLGLFLSWRAHRSGNLLAAIAIVGLTTVLVAPMSWQHHACWIIPALGAVVGDGRRKMRLLGGLAALVALYSPTQGAQVAAYIGFTEFWNLMYVLLIAALAWLVWRGRPAAVPSPA
jgi:alpha-1,2-mannosyltransferase